MTTQPKHNVTVERAIDLLKGGQPLLNLYIDGEITIESNETWSKEIVIDNCIVDYFSGSMTQFDKPLKFTNAHFNKCQFVSTCFLSGLTIENCTFASHLDFQAGGHNKTGKPVSLINNDFADFVNFFDCWYESEVTIINNRFQKGTNLLGKPHKIPVTFNILPIVNNNFGRLDFDDEGYKTNS